MHVARARDEYLFNTNLQTFAACQGRSIAGIFVQKYRIGSAMEKNVIKKSGKFFLRGLVLSRNKITILLYFLQ
jgi:hypothetical protein